jgi:hypothetical protein
MLRIAATYNRAEILQLLLDLGLTQTNAHAWKTWMPKASLHLGNAALPTASGTALLIAARTCSSFGRTASGCAAMYSSTDEGTLCFIPSFYVVVRMRFH